MAVIDMQKALGVTADGWWGDNTHMAFLGKKKPPIKAAVVGAAVTASGSL